ncbi:hypothetical protein [Leucobacter denitrificans]|uniref:VIT1/CCC1 transporter family protein n=1 Tax=Leucobacter denitrificans TaxID=683042 RepID=A0A7G9S6A6_9MICO|nr:hypothetical protein [Leucobacter denitrificans]QNN63381.1 hypothetical protein H9L06_03400 [Leucobacter denitrificans]
MHRKQAESAHHSSLTRYLFDLLSTAGGIYGLIIVAGVIIVSNNLTAATWEALLAVVATLVVFFAAHAYAATLAEMSNRDLSFLAALRRGVADSIGMIAIGIFPVLVLLLGVLGILKPVNAVWLALLLDVLLLGVLGWFVTAARIQSTLARFGGALLTSAFGGIIIALKALIH